MKDQDITLTLQETEQLCRLYMDCRLSVLEEAELQYVLTKVNYHSKLIEDVRSIMNLDLEIEDKAAPIIKINKKWRFAGWLKIIGIAASVAIVVGIGISLWHRSSGSSIDSGSYNIAYVNGQRLSDAEARSQIEAEKKYVDDFIHEMSELEMQQQHMIENFLNP